MTEVPSEMGGMKAISLLEKFTSDDTLDAYHGRAAEM